MITGRCAPWSWNSAEVLERIAVDHDQVGERAGLDDAELALLAQDLGADRWSPGG